VSPEEALAACEAVVRRSDPDRYFATLFAPAGKRAFLFVLYAFNHEIVRAVEVAREPTMAEIRLQWWREAVEEAGEGRPRAHPVVVALSELLARTTVSGAALEALIDARDDEITSAPFADIAALETHVDATSGALMRVAANILDAGAETGQLTCEAGIAYGLAGILRSIPFHAARGKALIPEHMQVVKGNAEVISNFARVARYHFEQARSMPIPRAIVPAILPASLVPAYLSRVTRRGCSEVSLFRRQLILLRAATFARL
jgi:phytoene synthase